MALSFRRNLAADASVGGAPLPGDWFAATRFRLALAAAIAVLTALLWLGGGFDSAEDRLTETRASMLDRAPSGQIVIVEIDARSLAKLDSWPWPRRHHAAAVRALHAAGASHIAFDVDFSARSNSVDDAEFARALHEAQPVILPVFHQLESSGAGPSTVIKSRPAAAFGEAWVGGVNIYPGSDGMVRDYPAATWIEGRVQPSLATLLADSDGLGDKVFSPDWAIDARRIPRVSFVDLIEGKMAAARLAGKRIVIGATAIELGDRYAVPRFGVVPGVVVQALAADSLLQGRALAHSGMIPTFFGVIVFAALICLPRFRRFGLSFPLVVAIALAALLTVPVAVQSRFPVSIDTAAMIFAVLAGTAARIAGEVRRRITARAYRDGETALPNRPMLELALARLGPDAGTPIVAAAAIERFATIRDAIGTDATSAMVRAIAERIAPTIAGQVYRLAPDVLAWVEPEADAALLAGRMEAIQELFRTPVAADGQRVDVSLTVGLDAANAEAPVRTVERALSAIGSARAERSKWRTYDGPDSARLREISLMGDLRQAMARGEIHLAYQPKLNLKSGAITDAEALVRWRHPEEGMIPPDRFIPLAEATGVIHELTVFVLRAALADCARWRASGVDMRIAVNVSAADLAVPDFVTIVVRLLAEHQLPPATLALEVTESAYISSPKQAIDVLNSLRTLGVRLSIDDYGTGQSTLSYLKQLPAHELKIDRSFVSSLQTDDNDAIMVRSTIDLAHRLGLSVVAEGIEDAATLDILAEFGCDYAQGYLIGKPMSFDDLSELAARPRRQAA